MIYIRYGIFSARLGFLFYSEKTIKNLLPLQLETYIKK